MNRWLTKSIRKSFRIINCSWSASIEPTVQLVPWNTEPSTN
jgi:hypothetical protein